MEKIANSEQLKIHTHQVHMDLEHTLIPQIRSIHSPSQYAELLKLFYTFYTPLENQLATLNGFEKITSLRKAYSIKNDLLTLGENTDDLSLCTELPTITHKGHALGVLYVLEGSVLGGKVIAGLINKQIASDKPIPFSFFLHYGEEAKNNWQRFKDYLDSTEDISQTHLLSAAEETFLLFKRWIHKHNASMLS